MQREFIESVVFDDRGLVPVITQAKDSGEVLMLAWMNRDALERTVSTKQGTYWSRSRQEIWIKGATSGNTQQVVSISHDCDGDALLMIVNQEGPACHTGTNSCFQTTTIEFS